MPAIQVFSFEECRITQKPHAVYHTLFEQDLNFNKVLLQEFLPNSKSPMHKHPSAELYIVMGGQIILHSDGSTFAVPERHVALVPASIPHCVVNDSPNTTATTIILLESSYKKELVELVRE